jgi:4-carboxymuconolactone decarboxylase
LSPLPAEDMTAAQRRIAEEIFATRGITGGPFGVWLRSPELADRAQKLGAFVRFHTSVPKRLSELVILTTARIWTAQYEWAVHEAHARAAGLSEAVIDDLRAGRRPASMLPDEAVIHDFVVELSSTRRLQSASYQAAVELLGEVGVVELVGIIGYYAFIAMTLNVFDVETPTGEDPLADL